MSLASRCPRTLVNVTSIVTSTPTWADSCQCNSTRGRAMVCERARVPRYFLWLHSSHCLLGFLVSVCSYRYRVEIQERRGERLRWWPIHVCVLADLARRRVCINNEANADEWMDGWMDCSEVFLICDVASLEGGPDETTESPTANLCFLSLEWRTPYACHLCNDTDYKAQETPCENGYVRLRHTKRERERERERERLTSISVHCSKRQKALVRVSNDCFGPLVWGDIEETDCCTCYDWEVCLLVGWRLTHATLVRYDSCHLSTATACIDWHRSGVFGLGCDCRDCDHSQPTSRQSVLATGLGISQEPRDGAHRFAFWCRQCLTLTPPSYDSRHRVERASLHKSGFHTLPEYRTS